MSDTYYEPRDSREITSDREHEDRHAAQDALEADGAYVPHNRGRWVTEAERQQIENAGMIERQERPMVDEIKAWLLGEGYLEKMQAHERGEYVAEFDDERYPSETERDWHPE